MRMIQSILGTAYILSVIMLTPVLVFVYLIALIVGVVGFVFYAGFKVSFELCAEAVVEVIKSHKSKTSKIS